MVKMDKIINNNYKSDNIFKKWRKLILMFKCGENSRKMEKIDYHYQKN